MVADLLFMRNIFFPPPHWTDININSIVRVHSNLFSNTNALMIFPPLPNQHFLITVVVIPRNIQRRRAVLFVPKCRVILGHVLHGNVRRLLGIIMLDISALRVFKI